MDFITLFENLKLLFKISCIAILDLILIAFIIILIRVIYYNIILGKRTYVYKTSKPKIRKLTKEEEQERNKNGLH